MFDRQETESAGNQRTNEYPAVRHLGLLQTELEAKHTPTSVTAELNNMVNVNLLSQLPYEEISAGDPKSDTHCNACRDVVEQDGTDRRADCYADYHTERHAELLAGPVASLSY